MKKLVTSLAVLALVAPMAILLTGCGSIDNPNLTLANFNRIVVRDIMAQTDGMTVDQVQEILGEPQSTSSVGIGNLASTTMIWSNHRNSARASVIVTIQFMNNEVISKIHLGLN